MQYDLTLRDYIRVFQKRMWLIIALPVLAAILAYTLSPTPDIVYRAEGRLRASYRDSLTRALTTGSFYYRERGDYLQTHTQVLTSREVVKDVAVRLGLLPAGVSEAELTGRDDYLGTLQALSAAFQAEPVPDTSIIDVVAEHAEPETAILWVNALIDTYAERRGYDANRQAIEKVRYIEGRIAVAEADLDDVGRQLSDFVKANSDSIGFSPDVTVATQSRISEVAADLDLVEQQLALVDAALVSENPTSIVILQRFSSLATQTGRQMAALEVQRQRGEELLTYQSVDSPEVRDIYAQVAATLGVLREALAAEQAGLRRQVGQLRGTLLDMSTNDLTFSRLEGNLALVRAAYQQLQADYQQARLEEAAKITEVVVIERAVSAAELPVEGKSVYAIVAALFGILVAMVVALLIESLDTSIGAIEDVEALLDLPVIGTIPPLDREGIIEVAKSIDPGIVDLPSFEYMSTLAVHFQPQSPVAEAYRVLRTNLDLLRSQHGGNVILLTSAVVGEGKTTTCANLGAVFAQMGRRTLIVGSDMRRPSVHRSFGLRKDPGLADVVLTGMPWKEAVRGVDDMLLGELSTAVVMHTPGLDKLSVLPSGMNPANPVELLASAPMKALIDELRDAFDIVLIDAAPVLLVADSTVLAKMVDGVLLLYEVGRAGRDVLRRAKHDLEKASSEIWGIILNDVKAEALNRLAGSPYYYQYTYAPRSTERRLPWLGQRHESTGVEAPDFVEQFTAVEPDERTKSEKDAKQVNLRS